MKSFPNRGEHQRLDTRPLLSRYECEKSGFIKPKCPDCSPSRNHGSSILGTVQFRSCLSSTTTVVFRISVGGATGTAFAESGATHSIASESLYRILLQQGASFEKVTLPVSFADGLVSEKEALRTQQELSLEGRIFKTSFILLFVDVSLIADDSPQGYILECDLMYPKNLHDSHLDLPFAAESSAPLIAKRNDYPTTLKNKYSLSQY